MKNFCLAVAIASLLIAGDTAAQQRPLQFPPKSLADLEALPMSTPLYQHYLRVLGLAPTSLANNAVRAHAARPGMPAYRSRFVPELNESVQSSTNIDNDTNIDAEPSVIKQTNSTGSATIVVHIKYNSMKTSYNDYYYSTKSGTTPGNLTATNYDWTADPFLAESQLDSLGTVHNRRVYASGLAGSNSTGGTAVTVWYSDDLGGTWTQGGIVNSTANSTVALDKPTCDVSQYSSSGGYLYIAYLREDGTTSPATYEIHVARSTDGGSTFDQDATVYSKQPLSRGLNMATVVVGPTTGYIYVLWVDYSVSPQQIYLARSATSGSLTGTWTVDTGGPTGNFFSSNSDYLHGSLRSMTVPMVRYNWPASKICLVWHEKESGSQLADVYYAAKGGTGWQSKVKISNEGSCASHTDQFQPALDYDSSGNVLVSYYDRQNDCNNNLYDLFFTKIDSSGNSLVSPTCITASPCSSQFVHIRGAGLLASALDCPSTSCATYVQFDGAFAPIVDQTIGEIVVLTPPHAPGNVDLIVNVPGTAPLFVPDAFRYDTPTPTDMVRFLVPVGISTIGAQGTNWHTDLSLTNRNRAAASITGGVSTTSLPGLSTSAVTVQVPDGNTGAFFYVPRSMAGNITAHLRVHDVTHDADNWGAELPVVNESEFRNPVVLNDIPTDARYRTLLRVYGYSANETTVSLVVEDDETNALLITRTLVLQSHTTATANPPSAPAYTQVALDPVIAAYANDHARIRVEIAAAATTAPPLWAFIAITNNTTQQVTTVTPTPLPATLLSRIVELTTGHWAGDGMCLDVATTQVIVTSACATGSFPTPTVDSVGHFEADGTYKATVGPPNNNPGPAAHFSGTVNGATLTITITTGGGTIGPIKLDFGASGTCPQICV